MDRGAQTVCSRPRRSGSWWYDRETGHNERRLNRPRERSALPACLTPAVFFGQVVRCQFLLVTGELALQASIFSYDGALHKYISAAPNDLAS